MGEDRVEQEKQPIITNLFPVGKESVLTAFGDLSLTENPSGAEPVANQEMDILSETNRHVSDYDIEVLSQLPTEASDQLIFGVLICHRALREEARGRDGILPTLTAEFIQEAHDREVEAIRAESVDKQISIQQAATELSRMHIVEFQNMEPEFSETVRRKFGTQPDWDPEQDLRYAGIINTYLLFRTGLSDPKNFSAQQ